ncbi:MAG: ATP-dependent helicase C-terminal domain-containing protein [Acidimicrobiales bacterium]
MARPAPAARLLAATELLAALGLIDASGRPTGLGREAAELPVHPRLATLVLAARSRGRGWTGALLAALLEEGDVVRGAPADRPVDLAARIEALDGTAVAGLDLDARAGRLVRRRAEELARRVGVAADRVDPDAVGALVAVAHPERLAQATGGGSFRFRGGGGGRVPQGDALVRSPWLAVAEVADRPGGRAVALAAPIDRAQVVALVAGEVVDDDEVCWDDARGELRAIRRRRAGALVLEEAEGPAPAGEATAAALVARLRAGDAALPWAPATRALRGRLAFAHRLDPDRWPAVDDEALLVDADRWLAPLLSRATGASALARVDLRRALLGRVDPTVVHDLDRLAPTTFTAVDGRAIEIAYDDGEPRARARPQRLFGLTRHPTVGGRAQVPVVLELLSPADRPIQVTADLPGFWAGSWSAVRKDLAGRYPKHPWPTDPATASPPAARPRRGA